MKLLIDGEDTDANKWNYYVIFNFSKQKAACLFFLQSKQQYLKLDWIFPVLSVFLNYLLLQ